MRSSGAMAWRRAGGRLALSALVLGSGPACTIDFPQRGVPADAAAPDAGGDAAPIERERFDWRFGVYGLIADSEGSLHAFYAAGSTDESDHVSFSQVAVDGDTASLTRPEVPEPLGGGEFELSLPDLGGLVGAKLRIRRDLEVGIGQATLGGSTEGWGGPMVVVEYGDGEPVGPDEEPVDFRFARLGADGRSGHSAHLRGRIGSDEMAVDDGRDETGSVVLRLSDVPLESFPHGGFRVFDDALPLRGIRGDGRRFAAAHRWSAVSNDPVTGEPARLLPELWLGSRTESAGPSGMVLGGRWRLDGVSLAPDGKWRPERFDLEIEHTDTADTYALTTPDGTEVERGRIEAQSSPPLPIGGVIGFVRDGAPGGPTLFAMGPDSPHHLTLWGTEGGLPTPRLFFGLRER